MAIIQKYSSPEDLASAAAEMFVQLAQETLSEQDRFSVVLAGGSTPRLTHQKIADRAKATGLDWTKIHLFWGDERPVPPDDPASNFGMAQETLLDPIDIPDENLHRIPGERPPRLAAEQYQKQLQRFFPKGLPKFDLVYLGLGSDGHTASIFPNTEVVQEKRTWVVAHEVESVGSWRITLTPAALNAARHVHFLVTGASKAEALFKVLAGRYQPEALPAQIIHPKQGTVRWFVDQEASQMI
jgi:6-phosphogluconolactonase